MTKIPINCWSLILNRCNFEVKQLNFSKNAFSKRYVIIKKIMIIKYLKFLFINTRKRYKKILKQVLLQFEIDIFYKSIGINQLEN